MQIRCAACGRAVTVAATGVLPDRCPHCQGAPVPAQLGRWRVERLLAAGGMGEVYVGRHEELGSAAALKLLPLRAGDDTALRERFLREARLTAAVAHPGVVRVLDLGRAGDRLFLVLELLEGQSLRSRLRQGPLPVAEAVRIAATAADAVAAAHAHGIVHRDLKPENLVLTPQGEVRVLDFGIARALQDQEPITRTGEILGTPEYMAPEQLLDGPEAVDARADVHALGVVLYELLTGRSPFAGQHLFQALKLVESLRPPPPSTLRREVPAALDAVVLQALAKDRAQRFADAAGFAAAVRQAVAPATPASARRPRNTGWPALLLATAAFVLGLLVAGTGARPTPPAPVSALAFRDQAAAWLTRWLAAPLDADTGPADAALRTLTAEPADALPPALLHLRGQVRWRRGEWLAAVADLDHAVTQGVDAARGPALVAWHCVYTLLPTAVDGPAWMGACDRLRRDRLLGLGSDAAQGTSVLVRAARQLAQGEAATAWATLTGAPGAMTSPEAATLALLAAHRACADRATLRTVTERLAASAPPAVVALLRARARTAQRNNPELAAALTTLAQECDPRAPERWLLQLLAAWRQSLLQPTPPERLRALAELAWLTGAGEAAPVWLAALRLDQLRLDAPEHGLTAAEAARLLHLCAPTAAADTPAVVPARALLRLVGEGVAPAEAELAALPAAPDAALASMQAWRDAPATGPARELWRGVAWTLIGQRERTLACFTPHLQGADASTGAMLAWLAVGPGPSPGPPGGPLAEPWRRARALGADVGLLGAALRLMDAAPRVAYGLTQLFASDQGSPEPAPLLALARAALNAGVEPEPKQRVWQLLTSPALRPQWLTEVCGGVQ